MTGAKTAHIFLDANTALHFKRPDLIDWCALIGSRNVVLIGAPILHRELEQQKVHNPSTKLRKRADAYIKWLVEYVRDPAREVRSGTIWHFIPVEPQIDFREHNLSAGIADDHFIASVIAYQPSADVKVYVATADIGMEIKLRHRKIALLILPDTFKLPDEPDAQEKELRDLRRQVSQRNLPSLALITSLDGNRHPFKVRPPAFVPPAKTFEQVSSEHTTLSEPETWPPKQQSLADLRKLGDAASQTALRAAWLSPERVARYNEERDTFLKQYREYLEKLLEWEETVALTVELGLTLSNTGTAPASDIDVILSFPDDLLLMEGDDLPSRPEEPEPPLRPSGVFDVSFAAMMGTRDISGLLRSPYSHFPSVNVNSSVSIDSEAHRVNYWSRNLKHGFTEKLEPIYFRFPSRQSIRQFQVEYEISSSELSQPNAGLVHFVMA